MTTALALNPAEEDQRNEFNTILPWKTEACLIVLNVYFFRKENNILKKREVIIKLLLTKFS